MKLRGYLTVVGAVLINATTVSMYIFGNLNTYIVSYSREKLKESVVTSDGLWIAATSGIAFGVGNIPVKKLAKRLGPKQIILLGCLVISGGVMSSYFTIKKNFEQVIITFGFVANIGFCVMYTLPGSIGVKWFSKWRRLIGIVNISATAIGAVIFNLVVTFYINPENISPNEHGYFTDEKLLNRVPYVFLVLGGMYLGFQLIGATLLSVYMKKIRKESSELSETEAEAESGHLAQSTIAKPASSGSGADSKSIPPLAPFAKSQDKNDYGTNEASDPGVGPSAPNPELNQGSKTQSKPSLLTTIANSFKPSDDEKKSLPHVDFKQVWKYKEFYILYIINFLHTQTYFIISNAYKPFVFRFYRNDHAVVGVGSVAAMIGILGRIGWFYLMKVTSYKVLIIVKSALNAILIGTLFLTAKIHSVAMFIVWIFVIFFLTGAMFVISPVAVSTLFGSKNSVFFNGMVLTQYIVSGLTIMAGSDKLKSMFMDWKSLCFLLCGVEVASGLLALVLPSNLLELREKLPQMMADRTVTQTEAEEEAKEEPLTASNFL